MLWLALLAGVISSALGTLVGLKVLEVLKERKQLQEAGKALEERMRNRPEARMRRAIYNPRQFRRLAVAGQPYDPDKHFRCDGRIDNKW